MSRASWLLISIMVLAASLHAGEHHTGAAAEKAEALARQPGGRLPDIDGELEIVVNCPHSKRPPIRRRFACKVVNGKAVAFENSFSDGYTEVFGIKRPLKPNAKRSRSDKQAIAVASRMFWAIHELRRRGLADRDNPGKPPSRYDYEYVIRLRVNEYRYDNRALYYFSPAEKRSISIYRRREGAFTEAMKRILDCFLYEIEEHWHSYGIGCRAAEIVRLEAYFGRAPEGERTEK